MKIFLSWSGDRSKGVAIALREWLPLILYYAKPWLSHRDIVAGERWAIEIGKELEDTNFGIVVLTSDNLDAPWILFEAGALSKAFAASAVMPYLVDVDFKDVSGPLAQFQSKKCDRDSTLELVIAINAKSPEPTDQGRLAELFDALWPKLQGKLAQLPPARPEDAKPRSDAQVLEDVVASIRSLETRFEQMERRIVRLVRPTPTLELTIEGHFPALGDAPVISFAPSADVIAEVANIAGLAVEEYGKEWHLYDPARKRNLGKPDGRVYAYRSRRLQQALVLSEGPF
jgi:hypothetical protein